MGDLSPRRPVEGEYNEEFSLKPVVDYLADKLSCPGAPGKRLPQMVWN